MSPAGSFFEQRLRRFDSDFRQLMRPRRSESRETSVTPRQLVIVCSGDLPQAQPPSGVHLHVREAISRIANREICNIHTTTAVLRAHECAGRAGRTIRARLDNVRAPFRTTVSFRPATGFPSIYMYMNTPVGKSHQPQYLIVFQSHTCDSSTRTPLLDASKQVRSAVGDTGTTPPRTGLRACIISGRFVVSRSVKIFRFQSITHLLRVEQNAPVNADFVRHPVENHAS